MYRKSKKRMGCRVACVAIGVLLIMVVSAFLFGGGSQAQDVETLQCTPEDIEIRWSGTQVWESPIIEVITLEDGLPSDHVPYALPGTHIWEAQLPVTPARKLIAKIDMRNMPPGIFRYWFRCRIRVGEKVAPWSEAEFLDVLSLPGKPRRVVAQ